MRRRWLCAPLLLIAATVLLSSPAAAIARPQIDDFQAGLPAGWTGGVSISVPMNGGPNGTGDRFLQLSTGGVSSQLGAFNTAQWAGNYSAATVARIGMYLNNFGPDAVSLRLMLTTTAGPGCISPCTAWTSTNATELPAASGWVRVEFSLAEEDLTQFGPVPYATAIAGLAKLHFRHDDGPASAPGTASLVNAVLGVDDITALPEPLRQSGIAAGALLLLALVPKGNLRKTRKPLSH